MLVEIGGQRLQQFGGGALADMGHYSLWPVSTLKINFAGQRNVSIFRARKFPIHFEIVDQVLPPVALADVTNGAPGKAAAAADHQVHARALGLHQFVAGDFKTPPGVAGPVAGNVRRQQRIKAQLPAQGLIKHFEFRLYQQHRAMWVCENVLYQSITSLAF